MSEWILEIRRPGRDPKRVPLDEPVTIGRHASNSIVLVDSQVSSHHAALRSEGGSWRLIDLGSTNRTRIQGRPPLGEGQWTQLEDGLVIQLGKIEIEVQSATRDDSQISAEAATILQAAGVEVATGDQETRVEVQDIVAGAAADPDAEAATRASAPPAEEEEPQTTNVSRPAPAAAAAAGAGAASEQQAAPAPPETAGDAAPAVAAPEPVEPAPAAQPAAGPEPAAPPPAPEKAASAESEPVAEKPPPAEPGPAAEKPASAASPDPVPEEKPPAAKPGPAKEKPAPAKPAPAAAKPEPPPAEPAAVPPVEETEEPVPPPAAPAPETTMARVGSEADTLLQYAKWQTAGARLVFCSDAFRQRLDLAGADVVIGRDQPGREVACQVPHDGISQQHARILFREGHFYLLDLGSRNGTYIGPERLQKGLAREIQSEQLLRFGPLEALFLTDQKRSVNRDRTRFHADAGRVLVEEEVLSELALQKALQDTHSGSGHLGEVLLLGGRVSAAQWSEALDRAVTLSMVRQEVSHQLGPLRMLILVLILVVVGLAVLVLL